MRFMTTRTLFTAGLVALLAGSAGARELEVAAGATGVAARSPSMDAVATGDAMTMGALEASVEVARLAVVDRLHVEAAYLGGASRARDFDQFDASLSLQSLHLGARAVRFLSPRWRAFARADLGLTFASIELSHLGGTATPIRDGARAPSAFVGAGLEVLVIRFPAFDVGLRGEGGWFAAAALGFQAEPGYPDDDLARIPTAAANLGSIDPSGAAWRFTVVGRF